MKKLNLLLIMRDFRKWNNPKQYYFARELAKITNLVIWHNEGNIHEILKKLRVQPDFILIMYYRSNPLICPPITGLNSLHIPFGVYVMDLHNLHQFRKAVKEDNVQHIFSVYRDSFYRRFPELSDRMKWLPQHVPTDLYKDYNQKKEIDLLMMGTISKSIYPLRYKIKETLKDNPNFTYHPPPPSRYMDKKQKGFVRERYARELNKAKIFFTCDSIFQYPILKYFEAPACKTLLLAPYSNELRDLGFIPGKNFVAIDETNFLEQAEYYLKNDKERQRITDEGYEFIRKNHSTEVRVKQFVKMVEDILQSY
ncbi:glycosyltransferase [Fervidibacillus halotolerans]|uniref:Glycosyltransferase n=1 Tax=Fervidibacillus halotolerans TaxID=2980027 RepID=A0A9E8M0C3_9BACI|nr:glycosyltransferase [Fervidibacillus halotolerans]WAA13133.1 glycosyltransferase [Fervidibacillus halotolerans]